MVCVCVGGVFSRGAAEAQLVRNPQRSPAGHVETSLCTFVRSRLTFDSVHASAHSLIHPV